MIVVGLKDGQSGSVSVDRVTALTDKTDVQNSAKKYLPEDLTYEILDFHFEDSEYPKIKGKMFQVLIAHATAAKLPFVCMADGEGIRAGAIYVRNNTATEEGSQDQIQKILNRRIATGHSTSRQLTLKEHLEELQALYREIKETVQRIDLRLLTSMMPFGYLQEPNPMYPKEGYEAFVSRLIELKKKVIEDVISQRARD